MITQEDKDLLLKDLCARQMYNVKCRVRYSFKNETTDGRDVWSEDDDTIKMVNPEYEEVFISYISEWVDVENVKPYLRPMSSMTEEEYKEWRYLYLPLPHDNEATETQRRIDWLNARHFDYRGLIEKGLALEAPEDMYKN